MPRQIIQKLLFLTLICVSTPQLMAAYWEAQSGALMTRLGDRLSAPAGFSSTVSQVQAALGISRVFAVAPSLKVKPGLFTLIPWRKGKDGETYTFSTHFSGLIEKKISRTLFFSSGLGIWWESMVSFGETVELGNGLSTSEFHTPQRWTQVFVPTLSLGISWQLGKKWNIQSLGIAPQFLSKSKRQVFLFFGVGVLL